MNTSAIFALKEKGILKTFKSPEELREEERERARVKRLESKLSPDDLKLRKDFLKRYMVIDAVSGYAGGLFHWDMIHTPEQKKRLRKIPLSKAKKLLTPKEFKEVKVEIYGLHD